MLAESKSSKAHSLPKKMKKAPLGGLGGGM